MGSSSQNTTTQQSTQPWAAAMPTVNNLFSGVNGLIPGSTSLSPATSGAIGQLTAAGQAGNPFETGTTGAVSNMLSGGGATSQNPALQGNLASYTAGMSPFTDPNYSTINSPAVQQALQQVGSDVSNQVNGQFAAAGRSGSGMNQQTLARGIAQGEAPIIMNQANQDTATREAALNSVYGAGNTTSGAITGNNQTGVTNQNTGVNDVSTANTNSLWGPQTTIAAQELQNQIPASNLGLLAQIGIPLAGLGTNSNGTSNTQSSPSLLQDITGIGGILGSGAGMTAAGAATGGAGLLGLLGMI